MITKTTAKTKYLLKGVKLTYILSLVDDVVGGRGFMLCYVSDAQISHL